MSKFSGDSSSKMGTAPGSLVFVGEQKTPTITYELINYSPEDYQALISTDFAEIEPLLHQSKFFWLNIEGLHDVEVIKKVGQLFNLHPLTLEDILNTDERPKIEDYGDYVFITLKMLWCDKKGGEIISEQFSLCMFQNFLLTFQEEPGDSFDTVRNRFTNPKSRIRSQGTDYLTYSLLDTIIDNYIFIGERIGQQIEQIEKHLFEPTSSSHEKRLLKEISHFKTDINYLRKVIRPSMDIVLKLAKNSSGQISSENLPYVKDLMDLCSHASETVEVYREMLYDQLVVYQTNVANRLNEIMKVLTVFSAIFIPLTFATGVYGTNFEFIPELHQKYGFYYFLAVLLIIGIGTWWYFKRKKWV